MSGTSSDNIEYSIFWKWEMRKSAHLILRMIRQSQRTKKPETHIQCDSREEGEINSKQKSGEVWHAISQLKEQLLKLSELVSGKTGTKTNNSDYEPSKREVLITSSNTENMSKVINKGNIEKTHLLFSCY